MANDINDFFSSWSEISNNQQSKKNAVWENKLKLETNNQYLVRFVPYIKEGKSGYYKSRYNFTTYAWRSCVDGRWVYCLSPRTWGERCPISEYYFKMKDSDNPAIQKKLKGLSYKQGCYYNVYVVQDPTNPENNGKVKVLQASKQINDVITRSTSTEPAIAEQMQEELMVDDMRNAMFDLSPKGVNLCIDVQDQGGFANYKASRFVARKRDLNLSDADMNAIYQQAFDLTKIDTQRTVEEVEELFRTTFLGLSPSSKTNTTESKPNKVVKEESEPNYDDSDEEESSGELIGLDELDSYLDEESKN